MNLPCLNSSDCKLFLVIPLILAVSGEYTVPFGVFWDIINAVIGGASPAIILIQLFRAYNCQWILSEHPDLLIEKRRVIWNIEPDSFWNVSRGKLSLLVKTQKEGLVIICKRLGRCIIRYMKISAGYFSFCRFYNGKSLGHISHRVSPIRHFLSLL